MKTIPERKYFRVMILLLLIMHPLWSAGQLAPQDTLRTMSFQGTVLDKWTREPVVFANVYIVGTNIGTVTNADGGFMIKVPRRYLNRKLGITCLGYKNMEFPIHSLNPVGNRFEMEPAPIPIREVMIVQSDPVKLIREAIDKIPENYSSEPVMMTSFYRETIMKNRTYVAVAEAVLETYKASYKRLAEGDRVRIYKGRKSEDLRRLDTVLLKFQGGPYTAFLLDVAKNNGNLLMPDFEDYYNYSLAGNIEVDDRPAYVIEFDQKDGINFPLYKGKMFIDMDTHAFVGMEFSVSPKMIEHATPYFIVRKPAGMKIEVQDANYLMRYRLIDNTWYFSYVRAELRIRSRWRKKLFSSRYTIVSEMAVTDIDPENVVRFRMRETTRLNDVLEDQVADFEDPDFWGEYNVIKPDESIEEAIEKLGRILRRRAD
ncbi:MAG TPA: carboxypeptidase-like regulatory domain-containing protein [Bacteroidetes bacterium]|nr:carboxypeptidase-like regulatory domain-containing protein [Bacteroidota bacterium]